jgi:hypothetical protein
VSDALGGAISDLSLLLAEARAGDLTALDRMEAVLCRLSADHRCLGDSIG